MSQTTTPQPGTLAGIPPYPGVRPRFPVATVVTLLVWLIGTVAYHLGATGYYLAIRRDPVALAHGQVWRVISPVLVQPDPVLTTVELGVLALLVGLLGERLLGTGRWVAQFLVGGLAGHLVGEWWQPYSSGISVAYCGVLGAVAAWVLLVRLRGGRPVPPQFLGMSGLVVAGTVVLLVLHDIHGAALAAGLVTGVLWAVPAAGRLRS
jgi:rhomboid protease GluP